MMRVLVSLAALALVAGCFDPHLSLSDRTAAPLTSLEFPDASNLPFVTKAANGTGTTYHIRLTAANLGAGVARFGLQALEDQNLSFVFTGPEQFTHAAGACQVSQLRYPVPAVETLLGHSERAQHRRIVLFDGTGTKGYAWNSGTDLSRIQVSAAGTTWVDQRLPLNQGAGGTAWGPAGSARSSHGAEFLRTEWVLVEVAAAVGTGPLPSNLHWDIRLATTGDARLVVLPAGGFRCGAGVFTLDAPTFRVQALNTGHQTGGSVRLETEGGSLLVFGVPKTPFGFNPSLASTTQSGRGTASFLDATLALTSSSTIACARDKPGKLEVRVDEWTGNSGLTGLPFWMMGDILRGTPDPITEMFAPWPFVDC